MGFLVDTRQIVRLKTKNNQHKEKPHSICFMDKNYISESYRG